MWLLALSAKLMQWIGYFWLAVARILLWVFCGTNHVVCIRWHESHSRRHGLAHNGVPIALVSWRIRRGPLGHSKNIKTWILRFSIQHSLGIRAPCGCWRIASATANARPRSVISCHTCINRLLRVRRKVVFACSKDDVEKHWSQWECGWSPCGRFVFRTKIRPWRFR